MPPRTRQFPCLKPAVVADGMLGSVLWGGSAEISHVQTRQVSSGSVLLPVKLLWLPPARKRPERPLMQRTPQIWCHATRSLCTKDCRMYSTCSKALAESGGHSGSRVVPLRVTPGSSLTSTLGKTCATGITRSSSRGSLSHLHTGLVDIESLVPDLQLRSHRTSTACASTTRKEEVVPGDYPACWSCNDFQHEVSLFCHSCEKIQPMKHERNYFDIFELEPGLDVDERDLEKRYWKMQRELHPDKYNGKSREERRISADVSAFINEAYNTLKSRHSRAVYYQRLQLQLHGVLLGEMRTVSNSGLLAEVMELREEVSDAHCEDELRLIQTRLEQALDDGYEQLKDAAVDSRDIDRATEIMLKLQYEEKILAEVLAKL